MLMHILAAGLYVSMSVAYAYIAIRHRDPVYWPLVVGHAAMAVVHMH